MIKLIFYGFILNLFFEFFISYLLQLNNYSIVIYHLLITLYIMLFLNIFLKLVINNNIRENLFSFKHLIFITIIKELMKFLIKCKFFIF